MKLDQRSETILSTVKPELQKVIHRAAELTKVPFAIVSGGRTQAQQDWIYGQGRTRPGMIITWTRRSNHIGGRAIDFSAVDAKGNPSNMDPKTWNAAHYKPIADVILAAGKELGIAVEWPLWKKGDWGHIQLKPKYQLQTLLGDKMSSAQIEGLIRALMLFGAGFALKYGIDAATWATITGGLVAIAGALWSWKSNTTEVMVGQVAKSPEVTKVVMEDPALAAAQPSGKVVAHDPATDLG